MVQSPAAGAAAFNRSVLIAVDASPNAGRAVAYAARMLGGCPDVTVVLLHVINPPEDDYFLTPGARDAWLEEQGAAMEHMLAAYRERMADAGFDAARVSVRCLVERTPSVARTIMAQRARLGCSTIVVGRHGVSRREEFLFGSTSRMLVGCVHDCALWVVA